MIAPNLVYNIKKLSDLPRLFEIKGKFNAKFGRSTIRKYDEGLVMPTEAFMKLVKNYNGVYIKDERELGIMKTDSVTREFYSMPFTGSQGTFLLFEYNMTVKFEGEQVRVIPGIG